MPARRRDQPPPATGGSEREVLTGFLDYLREGVVAKVSGLDAETAARAHEPGVASGTNLLGLVHHLTAVERHVFTGRSAASWPATFHAPGTTPEELVAAYRAAVAESDVAIAAAQMEDPVHPGTGGRPGPTLRWALAHMIEETGRHAGHLDILREQLDGATGR